MKLFRKHLKHTYLLAFILSLSWPSYAQWHEFTAEVMTTRLTLEFWSEDQAKAERVNKAVLVRFEEIEAKMSRYRPDSELSRVNKMAANEDVAISPELFSLLDKSVQVSKLSHGAFDITFASVGHMYDYRQKHQPDTSAIAEGIKALSYRHLTLDRKQSSVRFQQPGVMLDLGGIAKGYAVDEGITVLKSFDIRHASLSAGGDMYLLGSKKEKPWLVAIRDPRNEKQNSVVLPLSDVALSTSGDYERYFIDEEGERVHHIISPKSGKSANGLMSVSVLGPDVTTSDALSTAIFVMGLKEGMQLVNNLAGIDAILIDDQQKIYYSNGLGRPK